MSRMEAQIYDRRLAAAAQRTAELGFAGLVITPGTNLEYLIGSRAQSFERLTCLIVYADGRRSTVVVPRLELASLADSATGELDLEIVDWVDGQDATATVADRFPGAQPIGIDPYMPALHAVPLTGKLAGPVRLATEVLEDQRMVKSEAELDELRFAAAAIDRVHADVPKWLRVGRTEREVGADIAEAIVAQGHSEVSFVIVGSGPNGADPHHELGDRVICQGDIVVVDIGGRTAAGYHSDCTRTYSIGEPDSAVAEQYSHLLAAQKLATEAVHPGALASNIDAAARDHLAEHDLDAAFVHRTGHGIGLSVHEEPYIVAGNDIELKSGMTFSIEPGIYFPGHWGARIEDIVVVTPDGVEVLNQQPRELRVI